LFDAIAVSRHRRAALRDIVTSRHLHDPADGLDDDCWLIDGHDVTGVFSDDQASSFG
jgi:hypothetical protein